MYTVEILKFLLWPLVLVLSYYLSAWAIRVFEKNAGAQTDAVRSFPFSYKSFVSCDAFIINIRGIYQLSSFFSCRV